MNLQNVASVQVAGYVLARAHALVAARQWSRAVRLLGEVASFVHVVTTTDRFQGFRGKMLQVIAGGEGALREILTAQSTGTNAVNRECVEALDEAHSKRSDTAGRLFGA